MVTLVFMEVYIALTMGVEKSIGYPLPATRLSIGQCETIYRPVRRALLHSHHTTSKFPKGLLHGSIKYGGLGVKSVSQMQIAESITMFVGHVRWNDTTGRLMKINMQQLQIELGSAHNAFQLPFHKWKCIETPSWIATIWEHLSNNNMEIEQSSLWVPPALCEGEEGINSFKIAIFCGNM